MDLQNLCLGINNRFQFTNNLFTRYDVKYFKNGYNIFYDIGVFIICYQVITYHICQNMTVLAYMSHLIYKIQIEYETVFCHDTWCYWVLSLGDDMKARGETALKGLKTELLGQKGSQRVIQFLSLPLPFQPSGRERQEIGSTREMFSL